MELGCMELERIPAGARSPVRARLGRSGALCYHERARGIRVRRARADREAAPAFDRILRTRPRAGNARKTAQPFQRVQPRRRRERRGRRGRAGRGQDFRLLARVYRARGRISAADRLFVRLRE